MKLIKAAVFSALVMASGLIASAMAQEIPGDAEAGKALYPVCTACHGVNGGGNQALGAPKISGQLAFYTLKQLQLFQSGARGTVAGDMKGMEKMLKPALEKFMNDSGFVKKSELKKLEERVENLERTILKKV